MEARKSRIEQPGSDLGDIPEVTESIAPLLMAEFHDLTESLRSNEALGERRLDAFLTIIAAVTAGIALAASRFDSDPAPLLVISAVASGALLVFGVMTLRRIMERNLTTTQYLNGLRLIRAAFVQLQPEAAALFTFPPERAELVRDKDPWWGLGKAGLLESVAVVNCVLAGVLAGVLAAISGIGSSVTLLGSCGAAFVVWVGQMRWTRRTYESVRSHKARARMTDLDYWKARRRPGAAGLDRESFRAGVGMVVVDGEGRVLALERKDVPDAWQLPQGGIRAGEDSEEAAWRELREETSLGPEHVSLVDRSEMWAGYELGISDVSAKTGRGQVHQWFLYKWNESAGLPPLPAIDEVEFRARRWVPMDELVAAVVDFRRPVYEWLRDWISGAYR